ncbi:hypothetical protein EV122DRAFT_285598 [Schizophyllum commune]
MVGLHLHCNFRPQRDSSFTLFVLSPRQVDEAQCEDRRPRHNHPVTATRITASGQLIVADG